MINVGLRDVNEQVLGLMKAFSQLPNHIAKKHLQASMKRAVKDAVPALKKNTPKAKTYIRIRKDGAVFRIAGGSLRKAVTAKSKYVSKAGFGTVYGIVGYSTVTYNQLGYGESVSQSRKAIWLESGTSRGVRPVGMISKTMSEIGPPCATRLADEMAKALEKAAREVASKKNPGRS
jgi:hypothetical protein